MELFRHPRSEEKRQELISCFQQVWTQASVFGRMHNGDIKWNITPPAAFLPVELGAWNASPIRIQRLSPSPDPEAEFVARQDFRHLVDELLQEAANAWQLAAFDNSDTPSQGPASPHADSYDAPPAMPNVEPPNRTPPVHT